MDTFLLDGTTWDWVLDGQGNIAVASNPYSLAQDAASAIRLIQGELFYDTSKGIPYFNAILGELPPLSLMKALFANAALTVPEVSSAVCYLIALDKSTRAITGQVQIRDINQSPAAANFVVRPPASAVAPAALPDVNVLNASVS